MVSTFRVGHTSSVALSLVIAVACGTAPSGDAAAMARALSQLRVADSSASAAITARDADIASAVSTADDLGYTRGTYEAPMLGLGGKQLVERGEWVSVWKRETDGTWRIVLDIFNTDAPPPDHQPSTAERAEH